MNPALIVAASTATYLVPFLAVKWAIDHDGHVREDLQHAAAFFLALAAAVAHFRSHR